MTCSSASSAPPRESQPQSPATVEASGHTPIPKIFVHDAICLKPTLGADLSDLSRDLSGTLKLLGQRIC